MQFMLEEGQNQKHEAEIIRLAEIRKMDFQAVCEAYKAIL